MMLPGRHLLPVVVLFVSFTSTVCADPWGAWRGPAGNGISLETGLPLEWSREKNILWRCPLPGPAGATPVVWGDRIFVTSVDGEDLILLCVSTQGQELWRRTVSSGNRAVRGDEGNYASPSPVTDGKHVWATMANGTVACFRTDGTPVWHVDLQKRYGPFEIAFGMSSTPVLYQGRLYFQFIHGDGRAETQEALVAAVDAATGTGIWKTGRITGATSENEQAYASPVLYDFDGLTLLITHGADYTVAYDPQTGRERWRLGGLNPRNDPQRRYHPTLRFVASPAVAPGIIVCPTAKNGPVFAVRPDRDGDLTDTDAVLWIRRRNTPDVPSPLIVDDLVYLCRENGVLLVLDRATGEEVYMERTHNERHRASPLYADGYLYLTARDGRVTVVRAGRTFAIVAQNDLDEAISASPVTADGTLYLRTFDALWAIHR